MKQKKAVVLVAFFLLLVPLVFSKVGDSCTEEGKIDTADNSICINGAFVSPQPEGKIYRTNNNYDVVYSPGAWNVCDAKNDGYAGGTKISNKKTVTINSHQYLCYINKDIEELAECYGDENSQSKTTFGKTMKSGNRTLIDNNYYYCSVNKAWVSNIDGIGLLQDRADTCRAASGIFYKISWTGVKCCGDEFYPEFYNDNEGTPNLNLGEPRSGCWFDYRIMSGKKVSETNIAPNPGFADENINYVPDNWERNPAPDQYSDNIPSGGISQLDSEGFYEILVPEGAAGKWYGLKSEKINVRKNTAYNLSMDVIVYDDIVGTFYSLNLECHGDGTGPYYNWITTPNPGIITKGTNGLIAVSAIFKTTFTTTDCQIFPTFSDKSYGDARFKNIGMFEHNPNVLNYNGAFYSCGKSDFDAEAKSVVKVISDMCIAMGDYYCSGKEWVYYPGAEDTTLHVAKIIPGVNLLINPAFN